MSDYLICYDICNPRRLGQVHRHLKHCAVPLQYSVFLFTGDDRQLQRCLSTVRSLIDEREDDLRAYPLPQRGLRVRLGKPVLPAGIQWSALPTTLAGQPDELLDGWTDQAGDEDEDEADDPLSWMIV